MTRSRNHLHDTQEKRLGLLRALKEKGHWGLNWPSCPDNARATDRFRKICEKDFSAVRLDATRIRPGEAALLFGGFRPEGLAQVHAVESLSEAGDVAEAAARLFSALRRLDASGPATIAVAPIPDTGLGEAIRDRLERAAAPR